MDPRSAPCQLWEPEWCNCWLWAKVQKWTFGGYILRRSSRFTRLCDHFLWVTPHCSRVFSFVPTDPSFGLSALLHVFWHRGFILEGDDPSPELVAKVLAERR